MKFRTFFLMIIFCMVTGISTTKAQCDFAIYNPNGDIINSPINCHLNSQSEFDNPLYLDPTFFISHTAGTLYYNLSAEAYLPFGEGSAFFDGPGGDIGVDAYYPGGSTTENTSGSVPVTSDGEYDIELYAYDGYASLMLHW